MRISPLSGSFGRGRFFGHSHNPMNYFDYLWDAMVWKTLGAISRLAGLVGLKKKAREIRAHRDLHAIQSRISVIQESIHETQSKLRILCLERTSLENALLSAVHDVRMMAKKRIAERTDAAARNGRPFEYKNSDVILWMTDHTEIHRINDLRSYKMSSDRLRIRVNAMNGMLQALQKKHAELDAVTMDFDVSTDMESAGKVLAETDAVSMDHLTNEILRNVRNAIDSMDASLETSELSKELDEAFKEAEPRMAPTRDVVDLVFELTTPVKKTNQTNEKVMELSYN